MSDAAVRARPAFDVFETITRIADLHASFDQNAACARGWCLVEYGDGMIGIDKDDDEPTFVDSNEARTHVVLQAAVDDDPAYRGLCAQAVVIEAASIALRDALASDDDGEE